MNIRLPIEMQASSAERTTLLSMGDLQNLSEKYTVQVKPRETVATHGWAFFGEAIPKDHGFTGGFFVLEGVSVRPAALSSASDSFSAEVARCKKRLSGFQNLRDGWYDGDGIAPSSVAIAVASFLLDQQARLASIVSIFPVIEGGVLFEFKIGGWDYSIEVNNKGELEFLGVQLDGPGEVGPSMFTGQDAIGKVLEQLGKVGM